PREIQLFLLRPGPRDSFDLNDFFDRVSLREGVDLPRAVFHAKAVMSVLMEAVSPGEWADMRDQLPQSFNELFNWEDEGWQRKAA
ncbi:MAG TPA: DUF2267 domain-containing protein, partial [Armatimonadetes bacterium]|nr:DUF2267 domain-containing protein [Armatimonadota bacterium]